jgi:hypothetical protein
MIRSGCLFTPRRRTMKHQVSKPEIGKICPTNQNLAEIIR